MSEIEKYYNGEIIVDFEEETELEKEYNKVAELYSKAVKKKIEYRKEIERLNNIINEKNEEIEDYSNKWCELAKAKTKSDNIINELEKWLKDYIKLFDKPDMLEEQTLEDLKEVLDKLQELKGDDK